MELHEILPVVKDELNLYLVANRLKPATKIDFSDHWSDKVPLLRTILDGLPVVYNEYIIKLPSFFGCDNVTFFNIGADSEKLERLLQAKTHREIG